MLRIPIWNLSGTKPGETNTRPPTCTTPVYLYFQKLLQALQVSHAKIDEIIRVASSLGLHAKLTGAGGGGFAYILIPPHVKPEIVDQAKDILTKHGMVCWQTNLGVEGVKIDYVQEAL